jgi:tetratricopeptide (TPR) repeat protein
LTPERWQRVKEVFTAACALEPGEADAFLDEACGGDAELRAEVASLLGAHAASEAVVDRPAAAHLARDFAMADEDRWIGYRIGPYAIVSLIGRGGMGEVYRARRVDAEYEKEVAIKLVPGSFHAAYVLQRFRAERQILAGLDHPNIARLIDGGVTADGAPYLVMELVEGEPLDRYADAQSLRVRERLALFLEVCAAVSYAHQRLVVHRDLKPGNILVTADGAVKLLDFGIAKLLQPPGSEVPAALTVTLMRTLTPGFSSPEQVLGKPITTASDVYSLGVVLYVLLTGRSPYRRALETAEDAIREVCDTEPIRPSAAAAEADRAHAEPLGHDLDAIILRALRKEPERRYATVEQFADDVRRCLEGRPVLARGDDLSYRAGKFIRRHRLEVTAAALLALTLVAATIFSLREARIADEQRARAERHFGSVRGLANRFLFEFHDAIKDLPGATRAREQVVGTALEYLGALSAEAGDDHALREELAAAYEKVGDIQGQAYGAATTGEPRKASESYAQAIALLEPIVAADPAAQGARSSLARVLLRNSRLMLLLENPEEAARLSGRAVSMSEALVRDRPDDAARAMLADAYTAHAYTVDMTAGQDGSGIEFARKSIGILEDLERRNPDDLDTAYKLATAYSSLAITLLGNDARPETMDESLAYYRKAVAVDERLVAATDGKNTKYARGLLLDRFNIAFVLNEKADYRGALESARKAQQLLPALQADAKNKQARIDGANLAWPLGRALLELGRVDEAKGVFEEAFAELESIVKESDTLKVHYLLGTSAFGLGETHARLAGQSKTSRATRLAELRHAEHWFGVAIPHFERVTASITLDHMDMKPVNGAIAGLALVRAEIAKLGGAGTAP